jgi:PAS domain S-box-containing protein
MFHSDSMPDFRGVFDASPGHLLLLAPDPPRYTVLAISEAYARAVRRERSEIVGRGIFTLIEGGPADVEGIGPGHLRASLDAVVRGRKAETTPPGRLHLALSAGAGDLPDERWWRSVNAPVLGPDGELRYIIHQAEDVTELVHRQAEVAARVQEQERLVDEARAEALRRSEAKYSGILQASADAIISFDEQLRITLFNKAAEQAFGRTQLEVIGAPFDLLIPERLRAECRAYLSTFANGDRSHTASERTAKLFGLRKDGQEFPADATISMVTIDGKRIVTTALRDMTCKVRAEIEQRLLSEIGSALASRIDENLALASLTRLTVRELGDLSSLYLVAEDGSIQRHGMACRDPAAEWLIELMMGLPVDRRTRHPLWQILDTRRPLLMQLDASMLAAYALSEEHRRALEVLSPRSIIGVPLLVGDGVLGALFVATCWPSRAFDARDVGVLEEVARRVALSLENARLYDAARKAIQVRDEVLGIVAHDLRSPLGAILMQATLIGPKANQPERRSQRPREAIERSVSHMNRMINDLLEVARMESGHLTLVRAGLAPAGLVAEVVEAHRARAATASIELRAEAAADLAEAWGDKDRLLQVFENLLGNAIRVAPGGTISVGARERAGEILFWVADTGPGIAPEDLPRVFDRFWQARKSRRGGAGLGLSIVKAIVESHAGRVWFESKLGAGTTVFFTVPLAETAAPAALEPGAPPAAAS